MAEEIKYVYLLKDHYRAVQDVFRNFEDAEKEALKNIEDWHGLDTLEKREIKSMCYTRYFVTEEDRLVLKKSISRRNVK